MEQHITRLDYEGKEILLLATAHVSKDSVELVRQVIEEERPNSVCIELDEGRYHSLQNPNEWENTDIVQVIKTNRAGFLLASLALSSYQKRIAKKLSTPVGGEMLQGIKSAEETGAQLVLADRSIQTTFMRIWRKLSLWEKGKLLFNLVFSFDEEDEEVTDADLEALMEQDMLESVLSEMRGQFPKIGEILIDERDQHLANKIKNAPGPKVVAVLGGAHVPGVSLELYKEQNLEEINTVPPPKAITKVIGWSIPVAIVGLIVYSFFQSAEVGMRQLSVWVLWNSGLAGLFAALSLAHPLTIVATVLLAPFSTLNPLVAVGWFSGLVEASIRKPMVKDLQNVQDDIFSLKGFFSNRFLRILLVVIMANLGGTLGNFIGGMDMIRNLF